MDTDRYVLMIKAEPKEDGGASVYEGVLIGGAQPQRIVGLRWSWLSDSVESAMGKCLLTYEGVWLPWGPHWILVLGEAESEVMP